MELKKAGILGSKKGKGGGYYLIKAPEEANLMINVEGEKSKQEEYQNSIKDIETNRMYSWGDMSVVKENLWNKLHSIK